MNKIRTLFVQYIIFIILLVIALLLGYYFFDTEENFYKYIDNSTVAVIIGVGIGLLIWYWQHNLELKNKYYAEYINSVYEFFAIKQEEISLRKGKNRRYWN